jgi:hypothetical protein
MINKSKFLRSVIVMFFLVSLVCISTPTANAAECELCVKAGACIFVGCLPVPTSLQAVSSVVDAHGFVSSGGAGCGTKKIMGIPVACGNPLVGASCG